MDVEVWVIERCEVKGYSSGEGKEHLIVARGGKSKLSMRSPLIHF